MGAGKQPRLHIFGHERFVVKGRVAVQKYLLFALSGYVRSRIVLLHCKLIPDVESKRVNFRIVTREGNLWV